MQKGSIELVGLESGRLELGSVGLRGRLSVLQPQLLADPCSFRFAIPTRRFAKDSDSAKNEGFVCLLVAVGSNQSRNRLTDSCSGVLVALQALGLSKPELDEGLVTLCTGIELDAETLVDRAEFTPYSSGALHSRRLPGVLGAD